MCGFLAGGRVRPLAEESVVLPLDDPAIQIHDLGCKIYDL